MRSRPCQASAPGDELDDLDRTMWWHTCDRELEHEGTHDCEHGAWSA